MELNAEQIKKALEGCPNRSCGVDCPYYDAEICTLEVMRDALALITSQEQRIKELADRNEILEAKNKVNDRVGKDYIKVCKEIERLEKLCKLRERDHNDALDLLYKEEEKNEELTKECKKWQSRLKIECEYTKADTVRKMQELFNEIVGNRFSYHGWYLKETIFPKIAKEMLESDKL